jgi:uncharacterized protein
MLLADGRLIYSASDINDDLECRFLTGLREDVARGALIKPEPDETAKLIAGKGLEHEAKYLAKLKAQYGRGVVEFSRAKYTIEGLQAADDRTREAMASGAPIIYQATFFDGQFVGLADFLRRVEQPSRDWPYSYEVLDTKLAMGAKPYFVLQVCNYSEHLERLQGKRPECGAIVLGSEIEQRFRIDDFFFYYRHRKAAFLARQAAGRNGAYPEPCNHCVVCEWSPKCEEQREADDHLSLVAGIRRDQREKLVYAGIPTMTALAEARVAGDVGDLKARTFGKLQRQAELQVRQLRAIAAGETPRYFTEFVEADPMHGNVPLGFARLPAPHPGDVFFDMEGDPLYAPGRGLEYLFGFYLPLEGEYRPLWAKSLLEERAAFEAFIDFATARRREHPGMHIYHYAAYEKTALRRLAGLHGTRRDELDDLLRAEAFVDLYTVVRQGIQISQPSYSIKKLEAFYEFRRSRSTVHAGDDSIVQFEAWLMSRDGAILEQIERYNDDDCRSTYYLREWLLYKRNEHIARYGSPADWWTKPESEEEARAGNPLAESLLAGIEPPLLASDLRAMDPAARSRYVMGHLIDYHRNEEKPAWWRIFDRAERVDELQVHDHEAIGGLELCEEVEPYKLTPGARTFVYTFRYPEQLHDLGDVDPYCPAPAGARIPAISAGTLVEYSTDADADRLQIRLANGIDPKQLRALLPGAPINTATQQTALQRVGRAMLEGTLAATWPAAGDLLAARAPRLLDRGAGSRIQPSDVTAAEISRVVQALDDSYLVIQGPPGTGKSTKGASVIVDLLAAGKRVGVMSGSHKAIDNLLEKVAADANRRGVQYRAIRKGKDDKGYAAFDAPHDLAAGTSWMFSREAFVQKYDYLFVDEAGQISLADALACAPAARNLVLMGDPLQLKQVAQGAHPIGTGGSVLQHVLDDEDTIPVERGIFLDVTYRLAPATASFISSMVYEGRLHNDPPTAKHCVDAARLRGSGMRYLPVSHSGNTRSSAQEAAAIADAVADVLSGTVTLDAGPRPTTQRDILIVAPYNAQRRLIRRVLAEAGFGDVRVGTVDKFQGQEAPVVFYSMATSSGEDVPREIGFLFEKNRFNVAISRAQCLSVLVCSPELLNVRCSSIEQMELANLLCAYVAAATVIG